jgi:hypothetical protein
MKLDFNNFNRRGYAPDYVWESYARLACYQLGIKAGSLELLTQAWEELKNLNCHYVDRIKIIKHILKAKWQRAHDAVENAFLAYTPALAGRLEKVSLETKEGVFDIPFKKWTHGLIGNDLEEDTYFEVIAIESQILIPILKEHGVYTPITYAGSYMYLEIIDD